MKDIIWVLKSLFIKVKIDTVTSVKDNTIARIAKLQNDIQVKQDEVNELNRLLDGLKVDYKNNYFTLTDEDIQGLFPEFTVDETYSIVKTEDNEDFFIN